MMNTLDAPLLLMHKNGFINPNHHGVSIMRPKLNPLIYSLAISVPLLLVIGIHIFVAQTSVYKYTFTRSSFVYPLTPYI